MICDTCIDVSACQLYPCDNTVGLRNGAPCYSTSTTMSSYSPVAPSTRLSILPILRPTVPSFIRSFVFAHFRASISLLPFDFKSLQFFTSLFDCFLNFHTYRLLVVQISQKSVPQCFQFVVYLPTCPIGNNIHRLNDAPLIHTFPTVSFYTPVHHFFVIQFLRQSLLRILHSSSAQFRLTSIPLL